MNKVQKGFVVTSSLFLCCISVFSASAQNIEGNMYRVCKNDIFIDYEQQNTKKVVTEVKKDGCFFAEDLAEWLEHHDFYDISVIDENEASKKIFYESNYEAQENANSAAGDAAYIYFAGLVQEGDIIRCTDTLIETVTEVKEDGSFYTETEELPDFLVNETE